jgi:hypothetical protein
MNVNSFVSSFNAAAFVLAFNSLEKNAAHVTGAIMDAHAAGKAGLSAIMGAIAKIELTKPKLNVLRVACFRARKLHNSAFTLAIDSRSRAVSIVESASIARKPGAGRKSNKKKVSRVNDSANVNQAVNLAHNQRDAAIASAKHLASALSACGLAPDRIAAIGKGSVKASTVRAWIAEALAAPIPTGKRARRTVARAA